MKWISGLVEQHNNIIRKTKKETYKPLINKTVKDIYDSGLKVTINKVAEVMEIKPCIILHNDDLKRVYYDCKKRLKV